MKTINGTKYDPDVEAFNYGSVWTNSLFQSSSKDGVLEKVKGIHRKIKRFSGVKITIDISRKDSIL